ncbi:CopG family ribbon-helix-helix protein [Novosphingobium pokkalii]|uniref:CopG family ribbon-helix-helix protein n=1 Tax=Novosphingobium pokkalii TaxID=1770194 RepID=UPI00363F11FF
MAQLNVSFDDALLAEVDRLAAERGINRPELLRALVREAIGAEGRLVARWWCRRLLRRNRYWSPRRNS